MLIVIGEFHLPIEHRAAALMAMERVVRASRGEPGCIAYAYAEDVLEPGMYRVTESWSDRDALATHFLAGAEPVKAAQLQLHSAAATDSPRGRNAAPSRPSPRVITALRAIQS